MIETPFMKMKLNYKQLANIDELIIELHNLIENEFQLDATIQEHIGYTDAIHETQVVFNLLFNDEEEYALYLLNAHNMIKDDPNNMNYWGKYSYNNRIYYC